MVSTIVALVTVMIGSYIGGFLSGRAFEKAQKGE